VDAQQGTYVSPDGRYRWEPQAQRWVPVEVPAPPPAPAWGAPPGPATPAGAGGWGRPVEAPRSGWNQPSEQTVVAASPQAPAQPTAPWAGAPNPWAAPPVATGYAPAWGAQPGAAAARPAGPAIGGVAAALGGLALVIGAFLAWITASYQGSSFSQKGIDTPSGDGWFFVACGAAVAVVALVAYVAPKPWLGLIVAAAALAAGGLTIFEFANVHGHISDAKAALGQDVGSYGAGLYLLAVGSALALVGGLAETVRGRGR
jgi:hypothetical protein